MTVAARISRDLPPVGWFAVLALALLVGATTAWIGCVAVLVFALVQRIWPLHFITSFLLLAAGASFVDYTHGGLTPQLTLVTVATIFMLYCYLITKRQEILSVSMTTLTVPLLIYVVLSLFNLGRGLLGGGSLKFGGLEILSVLALGAALLVGAVDYARRQLMSVAGALVLLGAGHLALGLYVLKTVGVRTGTLSFTPVPGVIAVLLFNLILYVRSRHSLLLGTLCLALMVVHQFMSFTRGYWLALTSAIVFSLLVYVGRSAGARQRLGRALSVLTLLLVFFVAGSGMTAGLIGFQNIGEEAADRLASSVETRIEYESGSNLVRLSEYLQISKYILAAPWFGHGLGFHFVVREPFTKAVNDQAFVHQNYLLVWLKQGVLGLAIFVWMLVAAVRTGLRGRTLEDPWAAGWCMGTAGATVYVATYGMVHFPLAEVNTVFVLALFWGITISLVRTERWVIRWRGPDARRAVSTGS